MTTGRRSRFVVALSLAVVVGVCAWIATVSAIGSVQKRRSVRA